ncbi:hypothetical protein QBC33DRAFT_538931 [Phialemonium atrogriseum]|uniref:Uncharacterized protein n=1 Tax=Phialemonium atrogriseum TaxID=1093897 RepID=A0AAJ0BYU8_9PEZI|nr:uncharacterized protein QBC33DRAFT_538931 [Phialemonium atrogriseum]KAK1767018.1 hypothetical protein QBC33DRAFT_538931 [Phialemonium atrogriseum]
MTAPPSQVPQPFQVSESKLHRRYFRVPKNQEDLLNRSDAWSTRGFANVPTEVLQNLKDFHSQKARVPPQPRPSASLPGRHDGLGNGLSQAEEDLGDPASDDSHSLTSWSTSCEPEPRVSPEAQGLPSASRNRQSRSPGLPMAVSKAVARTSIMDHPFPSSSIGSDGEIEVEPPRAITDVADIADPVKRLLQATHPQPVPPSAQVQVVPCTYNHQSSPMKPPELLGHQSKRRRMKPLPFGSSQSNLDTPPRPATTEIGPMTLSLETRTSTSTFSSSNAGTADLITYQLAPAVQPLTKRKYALIGSDQGETDVDDPEIGHEASSNLENLPPNGPASQVPFTAFTVQYPEYTGSLGDFIKAIICIQDLQQNRALPEFLYDDFIRVFSEDYLDYIGKLDDTSKALTANQWYNENVQQPLYTGGIITRSTLKNAVESYPDEFRSVRRSLGGTRRSNEPSVLGIDVTGNDDLSQAMDVLEGVGEHSSDPIESTEAPWPSNRSPSLSRRRGEVVHTTSYQADRSPEITSTRPDQHYGQNHDQHPDPRQVSRKDISPKIMSQVAPEIGQSGGLSSPPLQEHPTPMAATAAAYARSESIPETAVKPKAPPRLSLGSAKSSRSQRSTASKFANEDPASRSARFKKFLKKREKHLQSSAPPSSFAG